MGIDEAVRAISLAMGTTSLVCSATTLLLIRSMKKTNGYLLLLSTITVFQILYDINYILRFATTDAACYAGQFLDLVGGLGVSFWTNILTFSVTYTIIRCKSVQVFKHYPLFSVLGSVFPLVVGIFALSSAAISTDDDSYGCSYADNSDGDALGGIYYWGRFVSVIFTIALCIYNFIRLRDRLAPHAESSTEIRTAKLHDYSRMYTSIYRMNFYSLAQIISRSGAAWNEWDYGAFSCDASEIMAAICSPSMGILNFLIFLIMQPQAWENLKFFLTCGRVEVQRDRSTTQDIVEIEDHAVADANIRAARLASQVANEEVINRMYMSEMAIIHTPGASLYEQRESDLSIVAGTSS